MIAWDGRANDAPNSAPPANPGLLSTTSAPASSRSGDPPVAGPSELQLHAPAPGDAERAAARVDREPARDERGDAHDNQLQPAAELQHRRQPERVRTPICADRRAEPPVPAERVLIVVDAGPPPEGQLAADRRMHRRSPQAEAGTKNRTTGRPVDWSDARAGDNDNKRDNNIGRSLSPTVCRPHPRTGYLAPPSDRSSHGSSYSPRKRVAWTPGRWAPGVVHAPGRAVSARVPGGSGAGVVPRPVPRRRSGVRGHRPADRSVRSRRRDRVLRHPHRSGGRRARGGVRSRARPAPAANPAGRQPTSRR